MSSRDPSPTPAGGAPALDRARLADALRQLQAATGAVLECLLAAEAVDDARDELTLKEAAHRVNKSRRTVMRWAARDGAAIADGSRWRIDMKKLSPNGPRAAREVAPILPTLLPITPSDFCE